MLTAYDFSLRIIDAAERAGVIRWSGSLPSNIMRPVTESSLTYYVGPDDLSHHLLSLAKQMPWWFDLRAVVSKQQQNCHRYR